MLLQAVAFVMGALLTQSRATLPDNVTQLLPLGALPGCVSPHPRVCGRVVAGRVGEIYAAGEAQIAGCRCGPDGPPDVMVTGAISSFVVAGAKSRCSGSVKPDWAHTRHELRCAGTVNATAGTWAEVAAMPAYQARDGAVQPRWFRSRWLAVAARGLVSAYTRQFRNQPAR